MTDAVIWILGGGLGLAFGAVLMGIFAHRRSLKQVARVREAERRARSAERLAELGSMTSGLAHEIKNPLSTIGLNIQLLAESLGELTIEETERGRLLRRVDALQREIERLRDILTDFLDFAGEKKLAPSQTDLNAMVGELADFFHPQAERHHVRLYVTPSSEHVIAHVDGPLVKQAVLNLLLNALQALGEPGEREGPREIYLRTELVDDDEHPEARLRIADTGRGMDDETMASIFTPYFTTKASGTGLGLPTARRIVEEHGGRIEVHSEPGRGTEFLLAFPVTAEPASA